MNAVSVREQSQDSGLQAWGQPFLPFSNSHLAQLTGVPQERPTSQVPGEEDQVVTGWE